MHLSHATVSPMSTADDKVNRFISDLEKEFIAVPEEIVRAGAQSVFDYIKGKKTLAQMFNITPDMMKFMVEQGYTQFKTGRYDDADRVFRVLTFLDWNNSAFHSMRGTILQKQKKYGEAVAEYSVAIKINPKNIVALVNRSEIFLLHGHIPYAHHDLDEALKCTDIGEDEWLERAKTMKERITNALSAKSGGKGTTNPPAKKGKKGGH